MLHQSIAPSYTEQDCPLTIAQGLDQFYQRNPKAIRHTGDKFRDDFFGRHDTIHVVFGCDTVLHDEAMADMWTIFGSDLGFRNYLKFLGPLQADLEDIFEGMNKFAVLTGTVGALPDMLRVIFRARSMRGKWRWADHDAFLDRPLKDVRDALNIRVIGSA